jgi:DNA-directed RNA polymerase subunit N (RpoN/RPB10)
MIIPIRCFTCNNVLASKYEKYLLLIQNTSFEDDIINTIDNQELLQDNLEKSKEIFKNLGIKRYCCKRHLLTHVDLIENI